MTTATAAVATAAVVAVTTIGIGAHPTTASAASVLNKAAAYAANGPSVSPGQREYTYVKTVETALGNKGGRITVETWRRVDGKTQDLRRITVTPSDGRTSISNGTSCLFPVSPGKSCPALPPIYRASYRYLASLPTDPKALLRIVYRQVDELDRLMRARGATTPARSTQVFGTIAQVMTSAVMPSKVAAAFFRAAARLPGARVIANASDALGRRGVGVAIPLPHNARLIDGPPHSRNEEMVFDKTTGKFLGANGSALVRSAIVKHRGERP